MIKIVEQGKMGTMQEGEITLTVGLSEAGFVQGQASSKEVYDLPHHTLSSDFLPFSTFSLTCGSKWIPYCGSNGLFMMIPLNPALNFANRLLLYSLQITFM